MRRPPFGVARPVALPDALSSGAVPLSAPVYDAVRVPISGIHARTAAAAT